MSGIRQTNFILSRKKLGIKIILFKRRVNVFKKYNVLFLHNVGNKVYG